MTKTVIHIGANKASSTTLQRALFSRHDGLNYLGEDADGYVQYSDIVESMISDDDIYYDHESCKSLFQSTIEQHNDRTFIYSNEDIMTSRIPTLCAYRLKSMIPKSSILLIIRNQYTAIPSFYINHGAFLKPAPSKYFRRHVSFDDWINYHISISKYGPIFSYLYNTIIDIYEPLFDRKNINILTYEEFVNDKPVFMKKLSNILEIDYEQSLCLIDGRHERNGITNRQRVQNYISTFFLRNIGISWRPNDSNIMSKILDDFILSGSKARIELSEYWRQEIWNLYASENSKIMNKYNLPLDKYGYPLL